MLGDLGNLPGARAEYERTLQLGEVALGPDHPDVATRRSNLGSVLGDLGDPPGAQAQYEMALQITEAALGPKPQIAVRLYSLGRVCADLGDLAGAADAFRRAVQIHTAAYGPDHPKVATDLEALADVQKRQGNLEGAASSRSEARRIRQLR
ncbi:tetratricopeptide repeat protein [Geodermatophilus sp. SYSU D00779]